MGTRLEIGGQNVAIVEDVPMIIDFMQSDIREPDKRNASKTKTVDLYGTNEINRIFENVFEVNIALGTYNPNLKTTAKYFVDEVEVFSGNLQLLRIKLMPNNNIVYQINIIGEGGNVFIDIGDGLLSDLDMSEYDHELTMENIINSWDTEIIRNGTPEAYSTGTGYYYPMVNRGSVIGDERTWKVSDFIGCFYAGELFEKIMTDAGYSIQGDVLDSETWKRCIVYPNVDYPALTQTQLNNRQFNVGFNSDYLFIDEDGQNTGANQQIDFPFNNESSPFFDAGSNYSGTTYEVPKTGTYSLAGIVKFKVTITHTNPLAVKSDNILIDELFSATQIKRYNGSSYSILAAGFNSHLTTIDPLTNAPVYNSNYKSNFETNTPFYFTVAVGTGDVSLNEGDLINLFENFGMEFTRNHSPGDPVRFYESDGTTLIVSGSMHIKVEFLSGANGSMFYGLVSNKSVIEGDDLEVNQLLPIGIKKIDFVKSMMQLMYLQVQPDYDNPKLLTIEPDPEFFDGDIVSWENKIDKDKEIIVAPLSELDAKAYVYKYKSDKDYYNDLYEKTHGEPFGTHKEEIENDFVKTVKTNELIFSPTPNVGVPALGTAIPKIYSIDNNQVKRITPNIRLLWAEAKTVDNSVTYKVAGGSDIVLNKIGYAGHVDDPINPTIDLNFGIPKQVYYNYLNAQFTNNNRYNNHYKPSVDAISDKDSKLVTAYLDLKPTDLYRFDFRKKYFIENAYYRVNKILGYDPQRGEDSYLSELLKLKDVQVFTPGSTPIQDLPNMAAEARALPVPGVFGKNNTINTSYPVLVVGDDNYVGADSQRVSIIGSNGVSVAEGLTDVKVINSNNVTVTESNKAYLNNQEVSTDTPMEFLAGLTQVSTGDPDASISVNTLGVVPTYAYLGVGDYEITLPGLVLDPTETKIFIGSGLGKWQPKANVSGINTISVKTYDNTGTPDDDQLDQTSFHILIYP